MASYQKEMGEIYQGPRVDFFVYPTNKIVSNGDDPENYGEFKNRSPGFLSDSEFLGKVWYEALENRLDQQVSAYGHAVTLNAVKTYVQNDPQLEHFVIVLITDGMVEYAPNGEKGEAEERREEIEAELDELTALDIEIEVIVLQMNGCLTEASQEEQDAYNRDERLWRSLRDNESIYLLQENSVEAFVQALLENPAFTNLLPHMDNAKTHWRFFQHDGGNPLDNGSNVIELTAEDWFIERLLIISPEVIDPSTSAYAGLKYRLEPIDTNGQTSTLDTSISNIVFELDDTPREVSPSDCSNQFTWQVTPPHGAEDELAIYFWETSFPFESVRILDNSSNIITNHQAITPTVVLYTSDPNIDNHPSRKCFQTQMFLRDEDGIELPASPDILNLGDVNGARISWPFSPREYRDSFLNRGPQIIEAVFQIGRSISTTGPIKAMVSITTTIEVNFHPEPATNIHMRCDGTSSSCELTLDVDYFDQRFYRNELVQVSVYGIVRDWDAVKDNFDTFSCRGEGTENDKHEFQENGDQIFGFMRPPIVLGEDETGLSISIPPVWLEKGCGFETVLVHFSYLSEDEGDLFVACDFKDHRVTNSVDLNSEFHANCETNQITQ